MADYPHDTWAVERLNRYGFWELRSVHVGISPGTLEDALDRVRETHRIVPVIISRRLAEAPTPQEEAA